jgi:hypothetical protein
MMRQRGASLAACGLRPWPAMRAATCTWPCACIEPPITPKPCSGWPPRIRKPGMMVWNGRLRGATWLGWPSDQREAPAAVLQRDAGVGHHHARAEALEVGLDQRHHHPALVGRGEVGRAAAVRLAGAGATARAMDRPAWRAGGGTRDRAGAPPSPAHCARVGDVLVQVGEGELHRLDLQVVPVGRRVQLRMRQVQLSSMPSAISAAMPWPLGPISCNSTPR